MAQWLTVAAIACLSALLVGCPSADYPTCSSLPVSFPGGKCSAYYYQTDYGPAGETTQAMTDCLIDSQRLGGNVVAFHTLKHGIGLRWLNANTLEVAVPEGVTLENQRTSDAYLGYPVTYKYRSLGQAEPEFTGCSPTQSKGST
jgi:hypothetical protein